VVRPSYDERIETGRLTALTFILRNYKRVSSFECMQTQRITVYLPCRPRQDEDQDESLLQTLREMMRASLIHFRNSFQSFVFGIRLCLSLIPEIVVATARNLLFVGAGRCKANRQQYRPSVQALNQE